MLIATNHEAQWLYLFTWKTDFSSARTKLRAPQMSARIMGKLPATAYNNDMHDQYVRNICVGFACIYQTV